MTATPKITQEHRVRAIASVSPFMHWPRHAIERLAHAARVVTHARGKTLFADGDRLDGLTLIVQGAVQASVTASHGRRVTFMVGAAGALYGMAPLVDDLPIQQELIAVTAVAALTIPYAAVRLELSAAPALWESIASEATARGRIFFGALRQFIFDSPRQRMAVVLLAMAQGGAKAGEGPIPLAVRLPQERLAEMLGVSRQWATTLVREMTQAGLVEWRYGRVTVLDQAGLHAIAEQGINAKN